MSGGWAAAGFRAAIFAGLTAALASPAALAQTLLASSARCGGDPVATGHVSRVLDGRTFVLNDREMRLAAIEIPSDVPTRSRGQSEPNPSGAAAAAKERLATLLNGAHITVKQADHATDRYGRLLGFAFLIREGAQHLAQGELLAGGHARVAARVGNRECAADLLAREAQARTAKLGLWGDPYYVMKQADRPGEILAERGHFALVEGKVLSVRTSGATIYVNFGRRWTEDFTVTILKRNERNFIAAGLDPGTLAGRRIRVRGWIEERGGPWIEATGPEQIELADRY